MDVAIGTLALGPALALGSFLNVVAARLPERRSLNGRSACPSCHALIAWHDNVPLASYLFLRGRCRSCQTRISPRYFLVELLTAVLVAASLARFGLTGEGLVAAFFCAVLVVLSAIDVEHRILPDRIVLPATFDRAGDAARALPRARPRVAAGAPRRLGLPLRSPARLPAWNGDG